MSSPTKSCILDRIPTDFLNELVDILLSYLTAMTNASQKTAIITPLSNKPSMYANEFKNYRLDLPFNSEVIERIVAQQFVAYLQTNDLLPRFQSAYTETVLLHVLPDIYSANDSQNFTLLGLLYLSAAFDCVDHNILVDRLQQSFGFVDVALTWIQSFLHGRTRRVSHDVDGADLWRTTSLSLKPVAVSTVHH